MTSGITFSGFRNDSRPPWLSLCSPIITLAWLLAPPGASAEISLEPNVPFEHQLAAGETHTYRLELTGADVWKVSVEQLGVDVELTLVPAEGKRIVTDSPLDRAGTESLVVHSNTSPGFQIEVHAREHAAPRGRYRVLLKQLPVATATDRERLAAETFRMAAASLYAQGPASRSEALNQYRQTVDQWLAASGTHEATRDLYCIAVLHRIIGEPRLALESTRAVLPRWQQLGDRYWEAATLNEMGMSLLSLGDSLKARGFFKNSLALRKDMQDDFGTAKTSNNICLTFLHQGQLREGLGCYEPLLESAKNLQETQLTATILTNIGWINNSLGEPDAAFDAYHQALAIRRAGNDRKEEAKTLNNLALLHRRLWQLEDAIEQYRDALSIFRELQDARNEGRVLGNLGYVYALLGEPQRSLSFLLESLTLKRKVEDFRGEIITLINLGEVYRHLGDLDRARSSHQLALARTQQLNDPRIHTRVLTALGWDYLESQEGHSALEFAQRALTQLLSTEDRPREAEARLLEGKAYLKLDNYRQGKASFEAALTLYRQIRDPSGEAETLTGLAQAAQGLGQRDAALSHVRKALQKLENLRTRVGATNLRASFQSWRRTPYELQIELLMELHHRHPNANFASEALAASEQARARALLDLLGESAIGLHQSVDPALIAQRNALGRRLNAKATRRSAVMARDPSTAEARIVELELNEILHDLDSLEIEIRRQATEIGELVHSPLLPVSEIPQLLDDETILLEYALGQQRSFLWLVTLDAVVSFELPPRRAIEDTARRFHALLSTPGQQDRLEQAKVGIALSNMILAPVVPMLASYRRLAVVADGALNYVPFAALPHPDEPAEPLVSRHEVVSLPSASVIAELRRRKPRRSVAPGRLAIFADPVFERTDGRLSPAVKSEPLTLNKTGTERSLEQNEPLSFKRLPGSRREAEAILAAAPPGPTLVALDFDATRQVAFGPEVGRHRVLHFATHGLIDASSPRLSGLVLSLFDKRGQPLDGFLRAQDVFHLKLQADLVVLSGCETALGREIRGEGLLGLAQGFMSAGAQQLMASLWRVEDRATAELMTQFYRLLWNGEGSTAALRTAQLMMLQQRRWKDPYYWAPFLIQGDWLTASTTP